MKRKCIRLSTWNSYIFFLLLFCIQKGYTITTNHQRNMHTQLRHERHYHTPGLQTHSNPKGHLQISQSKGIHDAMEAVHAFHPSNNLQLYHSLQNKYHYMRTPTTTTRKPFTTSGIKHTNYARHPPKSFAISNNNQISSKFHNHSFKLPYTKTISMSPSTVAPQNVYRNLLVRDEHDRKINQPEKIFFKSQKYEMTTQPSSSGALSKSSTFNRLLSFAKSVKQTTPTLARRTIYHEGEEQDDYFDEFNDKNFRGDMFRHTNDREIKVDGNLGKEVNLKNFINDDDNEETEEADNEEEDEDEYYDYLDDESTLDESSQIGSLTKEKWENYGTSEAVEKSRQQISHRSSQQMLAHNATAHISRVYTEAMCKIPRPKIIPIVTASKTYVPHCTVLHRCGDDTGCCHTDSLTCVPKRTAIVDLYFYWHVINLIKSVILSFAAPKSQNKRNKLKDTAHYKSAQITKNHQSACKCKQ